MKKNKSPKKTAITSSVKKVKSEPENVKTKEAPKSNTNQHITANAGSSNSPRDIQTNASDDNVELMANTSTAKTISIKKIEWLLKYLMFLYMISAILWAKVKRKAALIWEKIKIKATTIWARMETKAASIWTRVKRKTAPIWGKIKIKATTIWAKVKRKEALQPSTEQHTNANEDSSKSLSDIQTNASDEDLEFMSDTSAAILMSTPKGGRLLIFLMFLCITSAIIWASFAPLDEITRGIGTVVPSSRLQIIQNLEGGILKALYVTEGQQVSKGEPLLQLDDTRFGSTYLEGEYEYYGSLAKAYRLKGELSGNTLVFPASLANYKSYTDREKDVYNRRQATLNGEKIISEKRVTQAYHDLSSARANYDFLTTSFQLGTQELLLTKPLAEQGVISQVELLQLQHKVNDLNSERRMMEMSIPRLQAAHEEALAIKKGIDVKFREDVVEELKDLEVLLEQLAAVQSGMQDQVNRTLVKAPLTGIVKKIDLTTIGGVVQPGMSLMEIVPIEDSMLVEVNISPQDIGFLQKGMKAIVKPSAFDFAIYGGLEGTVETISADTVKNEKGESFYIIRVRTINNFLGTSANKLEIIPGMNTQVDIITGKKTVMQYLLKPVLRAKQNALTER